MGQATHMVMCKVRDIVGDGVGDRVSDGAGDREAG